MITGELRSDPLYVKVYELLKRLIVEGQFSPGHRLRETALAEELQVSRTPVRDALHRLEQDRLIVPSGTAYEVYRPTLCDIDYLYGARRVLEAGAAAPAARIAPDQLEAMGAVVRRMEQAYQAGATAEVIDLDTQFHELLLAASGNPVLVELHSHLAVRLRQIRGLSRDVRMRGQQVLQQHSAILIRLGEGDAPGAEAATRLHIEAVHQAARANFMSTDSERGGEV
jgi:DNA-binding GntR family transcriptional regulator